MTHQLRHGFHGRHLVLRTAILDFEIMNLTDFETTILHDRHLDVQYAMLNSKMAFIIDF